MAQGYRPNVMFDEPISRRFLLRLATSQAFWTTVIAYIGLSVMLRALLIENPWHYQPGEGPDMQQVFLPMCGCFSLIHVMALPIGIVLRKSWSTVSVALLVGFLVVNLIWIVLFWEMAGAS